MSVHIPGQGGAACVPARATACTVRSNCRTERGRAARADGAVEAFNNAKVLAGLFIRVKLK